VISAGLERQINNERLLSVGNDRRRLAMSPPRDLLWIKFIADDRTTEEICRSGVEWVVLGNVQYHNRGSRFERPMTYPGIKAERMVPEREYIEIKLQAQRARGFRPVGMTLVSPEAPDRYDGGDLTLVKLRFSLKRYRMRSLGNRHRSLIGKKQRETNSIALIQQEVASVR
jgi:hypothetical protein